MSRCIICKRTEDLVKVKCTVNNNVYDYCLGCLASGVEPYKDVVEYGFRHDMFSASFQKKILTPTLQYNMKTPEQFDKDVESIEVKEYE